MNGCALSDFNTRQTISLCILNQLQSNHDEYLKDKTHVAILGKKDEVVKKMIVAHKSSYQLAVFCILKPKVEYIFL